MMASVISDGHHHRHVGAADRDDDQHAQHERQRGHERERSPGRRGFLKVALGAGFAVAVLLVAAQNVIKTDTAGLLTDAPLR